MVDAVRANYLNSIRKTGAFLLSPFLRHFSAPTRAIRGNILTLKPAAIDRLKKLSEGPSPKLIRIGVKSRGCSGLVYNLEYISNKAKWDEEVIQDGVHVLVDSKALLSILGSEMDFVEDPISARFTFNNPNIKETCGCGLSFRI